MSISTVHLSGRRRICDIVDLVLLFVGLPTFPRLAPRFSILFMLTVSYLLFIVLLCGAEELGVENQFQSFVSHYGKHYVDSSETKYRLSQFAKNLEIIREHNRKQSSYVLGVTKFSDLSSEEFGSKFAHNNALMEKSRLMKMPSSNTVGASVQGIPSSVDWRKKNAVTNVKNQASCGSCWAFSAVGSIEGAYAIYTGELVDLSPQYLVDCDLSENGCSGGLMTNAFEFVMEDGVPLLKDYPYVAQQRSCRKKPVKTSILGYYDVPAGSSYELMKAASKNPVSVAIEADAAVFQNYVSGVITEEACGHQLNHGVLLVGYAKDAQIPYYIVKNSWGEDWGEKGYVRLAITNDIFGTCGIHLMASYPFIDL